VTGSGRARKRGRLSAGRDVVGAICTAAVGRWPAAPQLGASKRRRVKLVGPRGGWSKGGDVLRVAHGGGDGDR